MKFALKSRVLLELGAELISSDAIALYELIKNAIDAGSPKIEVRVFSALTHSGYMALLRDLDEMTSKRVSRAFLDANTSRYFPGTAFEEVRQELADGLAEETIDAAREALVEFYRSKTYIEIEDWGHGMSSEDIEMNFLTIGTPHRAKQRLSTKSEIPILGEKGIGRLSAMRLGRILDVSSATKSSERWATLHADWNDLIDRPDQELGEFDVAVADSRTAKTPSGRQGTTIRIRDLQSDWSTRRLTEIATAELSKLQDPFDRNVTRLDLRLFYNGVQLTTAIQEIDETWLKAKYRHGYFEIDFDYVEKDGVRVPTVTGKVEFRIPDREAVKEGELDRKTISGTGDAAYSIFADPDQSLVQGGAAATSSRFAGVSTLGAFRAVGYWYNRQRMRNELDDTTKYNVFHDWISQWGGGLLVYRDGYRVYPYANPDDDWLHLDKKALGQRGFKLNRAQFVGHVQISSRGNPRLIDQTNRQGLVDSPEKRALMQGLQYVIWRELRSLVTKYELKSSRRAVGSVQELDKEVKDKTKTARSNLRELSSKVPREQQATITALRSYIDEIELAWSKAKNTIKQQQLQTDVYLHLAGVGMLLEFIVHDMTRATSQALGDLKSTASSSPRMRSLFQQLKTLEKRLRVLDPVSTPGRQRKEDANVLSVIQTLFDAHEAQFERHGVAVDWAGDKTLEARVILGQMYQIFENLISNSVYWLGHERAVRAETQRKPFKPLISIAVSTRERVIEFADNGPGIDPNDAEKVFVPFFSKKPSGRGIGLYIVKSLCEENKVKVELLPLDNRGVHPGFRLTFA